MITRRRYNTAPYVFNFSISEHLVPVDPEYVYASDISEGNPVAATGIIIGYITLEYADYTVEMLNETLTLIYEDLNDDGSVLTPSKIKGIYFEDSGTSTTYPLCIDFDVYSSYFSTWRDIGDITLTFNTGGFKDINTSISIGAHYMPPSLYLRDLSGQIVFPFYDDTITISEAPEPSNRMTFYTETIEAEFRKYEGDIYTIPEYEMKTVKFKSNHTYIYVESIEITGSGHIGNGGNHLVDFSVGVGENSVSVECGTILFGYNDSEPNISITINYYTFY